MVEFTSPPLLVSTLDIHIKSESKKQVETITVKAGITKKEIPQVISPGGNHQERFDPPLEVLLHTKISVCVRCRGRYRGGVITISLDPYTVLSEAKEENGKQVYRTTQKYVEVAVGLQSLSSIVGEIVESCPRFRVLIMGKSGVGKSSLINKVFRVSHVDVSNFTRGQARIDQEYIADDNDRFVVHDSCGFEAGDHRNLDEACNFIMDRRHKKDLKDQLHAVWLCLEVPFAEGRVLETGVEDFLKDRDQILGNIPLVVVFTKVDLLVNRLRVQALQEDRQLDNDALERQKREALERFCLGPLRMAMGNKDVLSVAVSSENDYEGSLRELVEKTTRNIRAHFKDKAAHYIATMAQRVNINLKVEATIAVGEKRYWNMLVDSPNFRGQSMRACLDVLHGDIVAVWNFKDQQDCLYGEGFKEALLGMPDGFQHVIQSNVSMIAALITIIGLAGSAGTNLPIIVPVAGAIILCKLAHDRYKASQDIVRRLMAYLVDLTCVMQILWLLIVARDGEVTAEAVGIAMQAYAEVYRPKVHDEIDKFTVNLRIARSERDDVLDKIKELIVQYRSSDEDVSRFRQQLELTGI